MKVPFLLLVLALCPRIIFAQNPVPNSSFELWMDNEPFDWFTSNLPDQAGDNITRTSPGHSGSYALRGEVLPTPGAPSFPFVPILESITSDFGFPVDDAYPYLTLFYQFHPAAPGDQLFVFVGVLDPQGSVFGGGFAAIAEPSDTFALLNLPLSYEAGQPHRAFVTISIVNEGQSEQPAIGSYFVIDDIAMGGPLTAVTDRRAEAGELRKIYPNPSAGELEISFALRQKEQVRIDLYDLTGRPAAAIFSGELPAGEYRQAFDAGQLADGLYVCRLATTAGVSSRKVQIARP